jgi:4-hydroxybenzoate polyprenyltransferase
MPCCRPYFMSASHHPLCIDLDGTLIKTDLLLESFLLLIKANPLYLLLVPFWLLKGKAALKAEIASRVQLNAAALPYREPFIDWLREQKAQGRELWLCTASHESLANCVAQHLKLFDGVNASSSTLNLAGAAKARHLVGQFGHKQFDYCGDGEVDLEVWRHAMYAVPVAVDRDLERRVREIAPVAQSFPAAPVNPLRLMLKALRLHQWAKNLLIFVPLLTAHQVGNLALLAQAILAFLAFGLCSSSAYLLNDMLDLEADRGSLKKRHRPFAAGDLSLLIGFLLVPILISGAAALSLLLPHDYVLTLLAYFAATLAYSFWLKRLVLIDTLVLAALYTVRVIAGANATDTPLSFWLLLFSIFLFLSLACLKRFTELDSLRDLGSNSAPGRGYRVDDLPLVQVMGVASGFLSVLVLALYIVSPNVLVLYKHPQVLWGVLVIMLYWISHMWMRAQRGEMHEDPVLYAVRDNTSLVVSMLCAMFLWAAT